MKKILIIMLFLGANLYGQHIFRISYNEKSMISGYAIDQSIFRSFKYDATGNMVDKGDEIVEYVMNKTEDETVRVYPNPFFTEIYISIQNGETPDLIEIYDVAGTRIFTQHQFSGSIITLKPTNTSCAGLYFVKVIYGENVVTKALVRHP